MKESEFLKIKELAEEDNFKVSPNKGYVKYIADEARNKYVDRIIQFLNKNSFKPTRVVVNCGNGAAGPTFDMIDKRLKENGVNIDFIRMHHEPRSDFPNGVPNPLIPENRSSTIEKIKEKKADLGIAFDGDFDRCFFFDGNGKFINGEYIVGIIAQSFLKKNFNEKIVHDGRVIWNIVDAISEGGGIPVLSKTGHVFIKHQMRRNNAIYGGEL